MLARTRRFLGLLLGQVHLCAGAAILAIALASAAAEASVRALVERPAAVEGAPFLVPVRVEAAASETIALRATAPSGMVIACEGRLLWPVRPEPTAVDGTRWAAASNELRLVSARPTGAVDAYLAIELPPEAQGATAIALPIGRIAPRWVAAAPGDLLERLAPRVSAIVPAGAPDALLSRPDPDAPFERFRYAIGCALRGWDAPRALDDASPGGIAARATTAMWLAAIGRIAASSEGAAAEFAEALVATCSDENAPAPIAAWIADPVELAAILSLALDQSNDGSVLVESVVSWFRVRSPLVLWIDDESGDSVTLAIANPTSSEEVVRIAWLDNVWLDRDDPPLAALVPPAESVRVRIPRPRGTEVDGVPMRNDDGRLALRIEHRGQARTVDVSAERLPVGAAGPIFVAFRRPFTLVTAASGAVLGAPESLRTFASLRPRLEGWEVFAEVRCDGGPSAADAIVIAGRGGAVVTVRGDGSIDDPAGVLGGTPVEWRAYEDRFRVGFQLPPAWVDRVSGAAIASLGFRRIGAQGTVEAPLAGVPWRRAPRTAPFDLLAR